MKGTTVYYRNNRQFSVFQARLRDMIPGSDGKANPILWWCEEITPGQERDWVYAGADRLKDVESEIERITSAE